MASMASMAIMVIDDDRGALTEMGCMLAELGHTRIECYENGADALNALANRETPVDVILLDLEMPMMDGIEVIRHLSERRFAGALVLHSIADAGTLRLAERLASAHKLRVIGVQTKPISRDQLAESLAQCVSRSLESLELPRTNYTADAVAAAIHQGELVSYYQPKINMKSGAVVGVETLVRWNHPTDGIVYPDRFIPVAEASGCIRDLTRRVVIDALTQTRQWQDAGVHLTMSINVTMDDLGSLDFADFVIQQARRADVRPESVNLELTESRLIQNLITVLGALARLRLNRFGLSIDDFGTGHSSLAQLRDLPFDELKIDRSFVRNAWKEQRPRAFFQSSVDLARVLGLTSVAEGVQSAEDYEYVRSTGCTIAQGYFIAPPMPAHAVLGWIKAWQFRLQNVAAFHHATF